MKRVSVKVINAFSIDGKGGNPAGVVLNADDLTSVEKQTVAATLGISETAFVSKSVRAGFKLEFFTPNKQIAHCGHATIATFSYLKRIGLISGNQSSKETIDGNRDIFFSEAIPFMEQTAPSYKKVEADLEAILSSLSIDQSDLLSPNSPSIVNTGNSFLIVPVAGKDILNSLKPDLDKITRYSEKHDLVGYYLFTPLLEERIDASARMFAPRFGINEEAATGMAAGPLGCYLFDRRLTTKSELVIGQGDYMLVPSPSLISVNLIIENNIIEKLYVGGDAFAREDVLVQLTD